MTNVVNRTIAALSVAAAAAGFAPTDASAQVRGQAARPARSICLEALNKDASFMTGYPHLNKATGVTGDTGCEVHGTTLMTTFDMTNEAQRREFAGLATRYQQQNDGADRQAQARATAEARAEEARRRQDPTGANRANQSIQDICRLARTLGKKCP